ETSLYGYKNSWPIPRDQHALLIHGLQAMGARVVGLDLLFVGPDKTGAMNDRLLASVIDGDSSIVNGVYLQFGERDDGELRAADDAKDDQRAEWLRFTTPLPAGPDLLRSLPEANFDIEDDIAQSSAAIGHVGLHF